MKLQSIWFILYNLNVISGERILSSQWSTNYYCEGPPNMMYVFYINDKSSYEPEETEVWSDYYYSLTADYRVTECGNFLEPMNTNCCFSTITLEDMANWTSGSASLLDSEDLTLDKSVFESTSGYIYCVIQSTNGTLFEGYDTVLILGNGQCTDKYYKCTNDGILNIYFEEGCLDTPIEINLTMEFQEFMDEELGQFNGYIKEFKDGTQNVQWVAFTPSAYLIPLNPPGNRYLGWDIFSIIQFVICLILYSGGLLYGAVKFYLHSKPFLLYITINQSLWLSQQIVHFYSYISLFETLDDYNSVMVIYRPLISFTTFTTVLLTTHQLYSIPSIVKKRTQLLVYVCLTISYLILAGSDYFEWCYLSIYQYSTLCNSSLLDVWRDIQYLWILIMFIWNILPTTLLVIYLINNSLPDSVTKLKPIVKFYKVMTSMYKIDIKFVWILILQVFIMVIYLLWSNLLINNQFMRSDKVELCMHVTRSVLRALHVVLNLVMLDRIPIIFKRIQNQPDSSFLYTNNTVNKTTIT